jgi:signal transduction histidine kinase
VGRRGDGGGDGAGRGTRVAGRVRLGRPVLPAEHGDRGPGGRPDGAHPAGAARGAAGAGGAAGDGTRPAHQHDIVGHNLSVIITLADAGAYATDTAPERGKEALQLIGDTGRTALGELRRVLGVLREASDGARQTPELSPQPGLADIETLCDGVRTAGLEIVYRTVGEVDALDRGMQLTVYRIVQEALTNTLKHAGAGTLVNLSVVVEDERLVIRIRDNGPAGHPGPRNEEGHGLVGMHERAALYGGTVSAGPAADGGWAVEAVLDLTPQAGTR